MFAEESRQRDEANRLKQIEIFNEHQENINKRADTLSKAVFIISGGALTLSINIFLGINRPRISNNLLIVLQTSWISLFYSVLSLALMMSFMIIGAYIFGERWRVKMKGVKIIADGWPTWSTVVTWFWGISGLAAFLYGLGALAYVAIASIANIN